MAFAARRLLFAVVLVFAVSSASLVLVRVAPGDYATQSLDIGAHREVVDRTRARYGLDKPILAQYRDWLWAALRLDFGRSLAYDRPVADLVPERAANTALLAVAALMVATLVGVPMGVISGSRRGGVVSALVGAASLVLASMPPLLTSLILVFVAAATGWLPLGGMRSLISPDAGGLVDVLRHMVVPVLALALPIAATFERLQAQALGDVLTQPYILATVARGVPRSRVIWRDALRAAIRPVASVYGLVIGSLLSGSFVVEMVTSWPGLGRLMLDALRARDVYLVAGCAAAGALFLATGTLASDLAIPCVDPRARES